LVVGGALPRLFGGEDRHRRPTRNHRLYRATGKWSTASFPDQVAHRQAEGDLVGAGPLHVTAHRDQLGAGALGRGEREARVPRGTTIEDRRDRGKGLDVVDRRGHSEQARDRRERRLDARVATLALDRVHQRGFFAADVRTGATMHDDIDPPARTEYVLAQRACGICLGDRLLEDPERRGVLPTHEDVAGLGADSEATDRTPLDQRVRGPAQDLAILERPWL